MPQSMSATAGSAMLESHGIGRLPGAAIHAVTNAERNSRRREIQHRAGDRLPEKKCRPLHRPVREESPAIASILAHDQRAPNQQALIALVSVNSVNVERRPTVLPLRPGRLSDLLKAERDELSGDDDRETYEFDLEAAREFP